MTGDGLMTFVAVLLINLALGLVRVARGPTAGDRMLAAQLFGTNGVAILLVLGAATDEPVLRDVALVFAVLAVVVTVTYVKRGWARQEVDGWQGAGAGARPAGEVSPAGEAGSAGGEHVAGEEPAR